MSTIQYWSTAINNDKESDRMRNDVHQGTGSHSESDLKSSRHEYDRFNDIGPESDTEILNKPSCFLTSKPTIYECRSSSIREVKCFEEEDSNLSEDPASAFTSVDGFKLVSWFIEGKVRKSQINEYFTSGLGNALVAGYSSMHILENHLRALDPHSAYLQWYQGEVDNGKRTLLLFYPNILDCVRYLLHQRACQDDFV